MPNQGRDVPSSRRGSSKARQSKAESSRADTLRKTLSKGGISTELKGGPSAKSIRGSSTKCLSKALSSPNLSKEDHAKVNGPSPSAEASGDEACFENTRYWDLYSDTYDTKPDCEWHQAFARQAITWTVPSKGAKILDLACGTGAYTLLAAQAVGQNGVVCGVDFSKGMLAKLKEKKAAARPESKNILTHLHDVTDLASSQFLQTLAHRFGGFDLITCFGCLDMLPNQHKQLQNWAAFLKTGGQIVVDLPSSDEHLDYLFIELKQSLGMPSDSESLKHRKLTFPTLKKIFATAGLRILKLWRTDSLNGEYTFRRKDADLALVNMPDLGELVEDCGKQQVKNNWEKIWISHMQKNGGLVDGFWRSVIIATKTEEKEEEAEKGKRGGRAGGS